MNGQKHVALLVGNDVMFDLRRQGQKLAGTKIVRLAARCNLKMTLENLNNDHAVCAVRGQVRQTTECKQGHRRAAVFVERFLAMPFFAGGGFSFELFHFRGDVKAVLRFREARFGMFS